MNNIARISGIGYLIIFVTGFFSNFYVLENLVVPNNAALSVSNILENEILFRTGIVGFILMVIADLILAWSLYLLLKPRDKYLALLAGWFRLVNAAIFGLALYHLLIVLPILKDPMFAILDTVHLNTQVMLSVESFNFTWLIGLVFFGLHLLVLGYLIFKSGYIPKLLGILLFIAGAGYLIDSFANVLLPAYNYYKDIFIIIVLLPGIISELSFTLWLMIKGSKIGADY